MLGIHLILMRIWIQDPGSPLEKIDPNPGHSFKIYWIFFNKAEFWHFLSYFFAYFYAETWWTIQKVGNFYNLTYSVQIWVLRLNQFFLQFWLIFYPLDPDPWIRIFLWIQICIQEAKILWIQWIRIPDPKHCF